MNLCDTKSSIQRWTFLRRYSTTEKQVNFISNLLDQNGYRRSAMKANVFKIITDQCYNAFYASMWITKLLSELELRHRPKLSLQTSTILRVSEIADYCFCPASFVIKRTYRANATHQMEHGTQQHEEGRFDAYRQQLQSLSHKRNGRYLSIYSDLKHARLVLKGSPQNEKESFFHDELNLAGVPDYLYENATRKQFVVEEKFTSGKEDIAEPYKNHVMQVAGYAALLRQRNAFGYVAYWKKEWDRRNLCWTTSNKLFLFRIEMTEEKQQQFLRCLPQARTLLNGDTIPFDSAKVNVRKCMGCSVRWFCNHKSGDFSALQFPYYCNKKVGTCSKTVGL